MGVGEEMEVLKLCNRCNQRLEASKFREYMGGRNNKVYFCHTCKNCSRERAKERRQDPEVKRIFNLKQRRANRKLKNEVLVQYGGKCICCGESNLKFLTIDHKYGGGRKNREMIKSGMGSSGSYYYRWVRDSGYPNSLQVMCYNCNCGRQANGGICPHKEK